MICVFMEIINHKNAQIVNAYMYEISVLHPRVIHFNTDANDAIWLIWDMTNPR